MKQIPKALYQTADEIQERIRERQEDAMWLRPDSDEHRQIRQEISRLRIYAEAKRWLAGPTKQQA